MAFLHRRRILQDGDFCLFYVSRDSIKPVVLQHGEAFHNRFGQFDHSAIIGRSFGSQIASKNGRGFIHVLRPTPELWTLSLPHRTQIVYTPDTATIATLLQLRPGTRVIEAGTGSGSFSHAAVRTVAPRGHLFTYEFHAERERTARAEFQRHGMLPALVTLAHRDVCEQGFALAEATAPRIDATAVFLDLPAPWLAIPRLAPHLSTEHPVRLCTFSPCVEQVQKTLEVMRARGWAEIRMFEVAHRAHEARMAEVRQVEDALQRLRDVRRSRDEGTARRRERKRLQTQGVLDGELPAAPLEKKSNPKVREGDDWHVWRPVARVESEIKTHTSYLVLASMVPGAQPPPAEDHHQPAAELESPL